jgi:hypothetical protein
MAAPPVIPIPPPQVRPPPKRPRWLFALPIAAIIGVIYLVHSRNTEEAGVPLSAGVPGWDILIPCSTVISLNGRQEMSFFDTGRVTLLRDDDSAGSKNVDGEWHLDTASGRIVVALPGSSSTDYAVVSPEQSNSCVLVRGEIGAADLTASWFSAPDDVDDDRDPER